MATAFNAQGVCWLRCLLVLLWFQLGFEPQVGKHEVLYFCYYIARCTHHRTCLHVVTLRFEPNARSRLNKDNFRGKLAGTIRPNEWHTSTSQLVCTLPLLAWSWKSPTAVQLAFTTVSGMDKANAMPMANVSKQQRTAEKLGRGTATQLVAACLGEK